MSNQHNAIARRIDTLRLKWQEKTAEHPDWRVARWLMEPGDAELYTGMLKLESSAHGSLPEIFVTMFTSFDDLDTFSRQLAGDWLETYKKEKEIQPTLDWETGSLEGKLRLPEEEYPGDELLLEILHSFSLYFRKDAPIVLSLVPRYVTDFKSYNDWVIRLYEKGLPDGINLMLLDHTSARYLERAINETFPESFTLEPGDMDLKGAVEELATQGNPNDPQVQFRQCLFRMSKAVTGNRQDDVHHWGEKMLQVTQRTGNKNFFASAHLIYAGFLMHFKNEKKTTRLLDQGIRIVKPLAKDNPEATATLIQFYAYHGAYASMRKEYKDAVKWFRLQAQTAKEAGIPQVAIGAYKMAIYTAERKDNLSEEYRQTVNEGYQTGLALDDDALKVTEYAYIAHHYLACYGEEEPSRSNTLVERMKKLHGEEWREQITTILEQIKKKKEMPLPNATH